MVTRTEDMDSQSSPRIRLGRLLPGYTDVGDGANSPVRGIAATIDGEITVIAKRISGREIAVEAICAALGREVGLPIPEPLLLLDESEAWFFGSADLGHPSLAQFVKITDSAVIDELGQWPKLLAAACFDEWIANPDRHNGNLLYDGNGFFLIDHGLSIPSGMHATDSSDDFYVNRLLEIVIEAMQGNDILKQRAVNNARAWVHECSQGKTESAGASIPEGFHPNTPELMESFLRDRILYLGNILHDKIKPEQGRLKLDD